LTRARPQNFKRGRSSRLLCGIGLLVTLACTIPQARRDFDVRLDHAEHLLNTDRFDEAAEAYASLRALAPTGVDERYVIYNQGLVEERRGELDAAIGFYLDLFANHEIYAEDDEYTPRGIYRLGRIYYDDLGETGEGLELWSHVVHHYPDVDGPAHRSLDLILVHYERVDDPSLHDDFVEWLIESFAVLEHTRMGDNMLYWLAHWNRHYLAQPDVAEELFVRMRSDFFESSLRDEAEWQLIEMYHATGRYKRELTLLHEMRRARADTLILGPDATTSMELAAFRMGTVYLEDLEDPRGAIREWRDFLSVWSLSLERDDEMYGIVRATVALGDRGAVVAAVREFIDGYPESRWLDEVEDIAAEWGAESS